MDLAMRFYFSRPLSGDEYVEYLGVKRKLSPRDYAYLYSCELKLWYTRVHVNRVCDACGGRLSTDRIVCLECKSNSSPFDSIDICSNKACMASEVVRKDLDKPHLPSHRSFKAREFLLTRDLVAAWIRAEGAISQGDRAITGALAGYRLKMTDPPHSEMHSTPSPTLVTSVSAPHDPPSTQTELLNSDFNMARIPSADPRQTHDTSPEQKAAVAVPDIRCYRCQNELESPCWYCIDCPGTVLVCLDCDPPGGFKFDKRDHEKEHTLLQVCKIVEEEPTQEANSASLETRVKLLEDRFSKFEGMLEKVLQQLATGEVRMNGMASKTDIEP